MAAGIETVCHNNFSPCKLEFWGNTSIAIIDFDASASGLRAHDFGYAAWLWLDLGSPVIDALDLQRRLATFLEAYGVPSPDPILEAMLERQVMLAARWTGLMTSIHEGSEMAEIWLKGHHGFVSLDSVEKLNYSTFRRIRWTRWRGAVSIVRSST